MLGPLLGSTALHREDLGTHGGSWAVGGRGEAEAGRGRAVGRHADLVHFVLHPPTHLQTTLTPFHSGVVRNGSVMLVEQGQKVGRGRRVW